MQVHRIYETEAAHIGQEFVLSTDNARIVRSVLRLSKDDSIEILDGRGKTAKARLTEVGNKRTAADVLELNSHTPISPAITLLQGLPKGEKASLIVQKAVELGVARILFFESGHTVAKMRGGQCDRWNRVAVEALRQSGNPFLPEIPDPISLTKAVQEAASATCRIILDEKERTKPLRDCGIKSPESVALAIGPEGGWSDSDRELLRSAGFVSAGLGPYILRTETAAIAAISSIRALLL